MESSQSPPTHSNSNSLYEQQAKVLFICSQVSVLGNIAACLLIAYCIMKIRWNKLKLLKAIVGMNRKVKVKEISSSSTHILLIHYCMFTSLRAFMCIRSVQVRKKYSDDLHCIFVSGIYFLLLTVNAFNLLAISIAEAYQYTEKSTALFTQRTRTNWANCCCSAFAIMTLWFGSVIVNMGVTFVPIDKNVTKSLNDKWKQNLQDQNSTHGSYTMTCALDYGVASGYGTKLLRGSLVLVAIAVTAVYIYKFNSELYQHWTYLAMEVEEEERLEVNQNSGGTDQLKRLKVIQGKTRRHLYSIATLLCCFAMGWLPYFAVMTFEPALGRQNANSITVVTVKRSVALLAWTLDVAVTPFIVFGLVAYTAYAERQKTISKYSVVLELINVCESEVNTEIEPLNTYFEHHLSTT